MRRILIAIIIVAAAAGGGPARDTAAAGTTERVSLDSAGVQGNGNTGSNSGSTVSTDGRFVAFDSEATNLVLGDTNALRDVFVRDRVNSTTERVSVSSAGDQGNGASYAEDISADGRFVSFYSEASSLAAADTNVFFGDAFVHDRQTGTTELISVGTSGFSGNSLSAPHGISGDGRFVA